MSQRAVGRFEHCALLAALIAFAISPTGCVSTDLPPLHENRSSLEDDEQELWRQARAASERLDAQCVDDAALEAYLDGIAARLLGSDRERLPSKPRVRVLQSADRNAFALSDGSVYLSAGLVTTFTSEDQLAAVLGHELTHFTHRHALRGQRGETNDRRAIGTASLVVAALLRSPEIAGDLRDFSMVAAVAGYSRDFEREADDVGFARAVRAGYAPAELVGAFERVRDAIPELEREAESVPFYASHPAMNERIARFRELAGKRAAQNARAPDRNAYRQATAAAHAGVVEAHLLTLDPTAAAASLATYRELRPGAAEADYLDGRLAQIRGKSLDDALAHYRAAIAVDPAHAGAWRRMGMLERRRHDDDAAREAFRHALALAPRAPDAAGLKQLAEASPDVMRSALPEAEGTFRGRGPRRIVMAPARVPPGLEIEPVRLRGLDADVANALRAFGYQVVDASVYTSLADSFGSSVRPEIHTLVRNELFARYDAEALLLPVLRVERADVADGTMSCRTGDRPLLLDPDGTEWDRASGRHFTGTGGALSLELVVLDDLGRPIGSGTGSCLPLAKIDSNGRVADLLPSQRLADRESRREAAERAVADIEPVADGDS